MGKQVVRRVLAIFGLLVLILAFGTSALLFTEWGCERARRAIEAVVNSGISGRISIERVTELAPPRVRARGITIYAPNGQPAIEVQNANIRFALWSLIQGDVVWERAEISHGVVRLHEDEQGKLNLEETFRAPKKKDEAEKKQKSKEEKKKSESDLDLQAMVTSDMTLLISGKGMPTMRLTNLYGIMRIQEPPGGPLTLRFDEYKGSMPKGLPHGSLTFRAVQGEVTPDKERLLHFEGNGRFEGEAVAFELDIDHEPETMTKIRAYFPETSAPSLKTLALDGWSKVIKELDIQVQQGKP